MDYGSHGIIIPHGRTVEKKSRRSTSHSIQLQMTIHRITQNIISQGNYNHIRVPMLSDVNATKYKMEKISTRRPLILGEPESCRSIKTIQTIQTIREIKNELVCLWVSLWEQGYAAWDFDLFVQDDKVVLLDFDRFGFRMSGMQNGVDLPLQIPVGSFFNHVCFPTDFKQMVEDQIQEVLHF